MWYTATMDWKDDLINWYTASHRDLPWRGTRDPYRIWLSEIMLQQTRVAAVVPYYERFLSELPTVAALAGADDDRLLKLWQGLGYFSRAKNLKRAAMLIESEYEGRVPDRYEKLIKLPGIGSYTAGAIASIAFGERVPAVDGNVLRVMARKNADPRDIADPRTKDAVFSELKQQMPSDPGTFNQAMMELGACVCVPNGEPLCDRCPIQKHCKAYRTNAVSSYPNKSKKPKRTIEQMTVFVLKKGDAFLIRKRPEEGLLGGLYELPNLPGRLTPMDAADAIGAMGLRAIGPIAQVERKHLFTHREWQMRVFAVETEGDAPNGLLWYDGTQSLPTAFRICIF